MWGTFLSEPLRIVALVGLYPANQLMRRMPILDRNRFLWLQRDVSSKHYAVLVRISPGYPPVKGRLHTCYSPVRRSPAEESKLPSPLPLDLHVLSLSLAFILSQDQTLRCCLSCFLLFKSNKARIIEFLPFTSSACAAANCVPDPRIASDLLSLLLQN